MKREEKDDSLYYQAVSRYFLEQRGSPFFISSGEIEKIMEWRNMGIPLHVVLEGIKEGFATYKRRTGRKGKITSLTFCYPFVLRSFAAHKERKVGGREKPIPKEDKRQELQKAVERFLVSCPENLKEIRRVFRHVRETISHDCAEERLEQLENEVESLLIESASDAEREKIQKEAITEFGDQRSQEWERIVNLMLIKHLREKYGIPHISLFYY